MAERRGDPSNSRPRESSKLDEGQGWDLWAFRYAIRVPRSSPIVPTLSTPTVAWAWQSMPVLKKPRTWHTASRHESLRIHT